MVNFSELVPEEKHRVLICCIMGLADSGVSSSYPNPLYKLGYSVEIMEGDSVSNSLGKSVAPDLVLVDANDNHAIIVECKSGQLGRDQIERYMGVKKEDLVDWGISSKDPRRLVHDVAFVASYENSGNLMSTISREDIKCSFTGIVVNLVNIEKIKNNFNSMKVNNIFPVTASLSKAPQYLYPIGRESPDFIIMDNLFPSLVSRLFLCECEEFENSIEDIIIDLYPYWVEMGIDVKNKIKRNIIRVIEVASKHSLLKNYIEYNDGIVKFKIHNFKNTRVLQSFQRAGTEYISILKRQYSQTRLSEWD